MPSRCRQAGPRRPAGKAALQGRLLALLAWLLLLCLGMPARAAPEAALLEIDGAIGPASSLYFDYASRQAEARGARLIILRLDTPGGLDQPMRDIVKRILSSRIPVAVYVAPSGSRAASAGTYLLHAAHVAAMAPATNLGAATPVPVMGKEREPPQERDGRRDRNGGAGPPEQPGSNDAASRKAVNDAAAYLRSLAEIRGRNVDWAEQAVRAGASLSAEAALEKKVIDLIAVDTGDLIAQLDGRRLTLAGGKITLSTQGMTTTAIPPTWRQSFLAVLTNPTVAYLLMLIGIYGLLLEGYSPGAILPGVAGGICLLLALYAFQLLPINYAGLALLALGLVLIVAETVVPSAGVLGIGGVVAFVAGSILLLDSDVPGYAVPLGLVAGAASAAALLLLLGLSLLLRARRRPPLQAQSGLAGATARALADFSGDGWVEVRGERWRAHSREPVRRGQRLRIVRVQGLRLEVAPDDTETPWQEPLPRA
ncbi:MAG: NfeD family protein [Pseudomonadota bacterium]